ncbi:hypothetical protein M7I_6488 [Glarea lozoyensis 74030]|uniref:Uncharacterized protein n=1 Tax=Glarea lozoyensis (strain ATCC 74030 / MF5533) TaxID=1104152 RepID=H0EUP9_GLAL7|nr:hypothetical protein M7I_6488 [Glarea lozoyensis 74030]
MEVLRYRSPEVQVLEGDVEGASDTGSKPDCKSNEEPTASITFN